MPHSHPTDVSMIDLERPTVARAPAEVSAHLDRILTTADPSDQVVAFIRSFHAGRVYQDHLFRVVATMPSWALPLLVAVPNPGRITPEQSDRSRLAAAAIAAADRTGEIS